MIFRPELVKAIQQGKKRMTRRPAKDKQPRYRVGRCYAVQPGRGKPQSCRITVTEVRLERLGDLSLPDARREGFRTRDEFFDYWRGLYGRLDEDQMVWVIGFLLGDFSDEPRLLALRPGAPHGDYVSNPHLAIREDASEAVDARTQERFSRQARERDSARQADPVRQARDRIVRDLETLRENVPVNSAARNTVRRLEKELQVLERHLAA